MPDNETVTLRIVWNMRRKKWTITGDCRLPGNAHRHMFLETEQGCDLDEQMFLKLAQGLKWDLESFLPY